MSFRMKLFLFFGLSLLIPSIAIGASSYYRAQSKVKQEINTNANSSIKILNQSLTDTLNSWESDVVVLGNNIKKDKYPKDTGKNIAPVDTMLANFISGQHSFLHIYVGTKSGTFIKRPFTKMSSSYDPRKRSWYQEAEQHPGQIIITPPYKNADTNQMLITIAEELPNKQGVLGADVSLTTLSKLGSVVHIGSEGYLAIIDPQTKQVVVDPKITPGTILKNAPFSPMYQSTSGYFEYALNGQNEEMNFITNPVTGWKIAGIMDPQEDTQAARPILWVSLVVLIIALLCGLFLTFLFVRSTNKRLKRLTDTSALVAEGDLTHQINDTSEDEFGILGQGFDKMTASLHEIITETANTAQQVAASAQELSASSEENSRATEQITNTMQEVSEGAQRQTNNIEKSKQSISEMTSKIQHIAKSASTVSEFSKLANERTIDGNEAVQTAVNQITNISTTVNELTETMRKLGTQSQEIGQIVDAITSIANETNLLALNAAIEAARAGESGRGFAVVADEVRKLAEQSAKSAEQISNLIGGIQNGTSQAVSATEHTMKQVDEGIEAVNIAGESFENIHDSIQSVSQQIHEVSVSVQQLSASAEQIDTGFGKVAAISEQTTAGMQNVSASSEEQLAASEEISASAASLTQMAEKLQSMVSKFQV